jgi:hypothetical protein
MTRETLQIIIDAIDKTSSTFRGVEGNIKNIEEKIHSVGKTMQSVGTKMMAAGAAMAGALVFEGKKALDSYMEQENAVKRLEGALKNVKTARDNDITSLLAQASALQKVTRFGDEQIISAQGILATFQLNQKQIERLIPSLIDMAEGVARIDGSMPSLEQNAIMVAKALGGEDIEGLTGALRRVGVIMTPTQQQILKTGTMEQRLNIMTEILRQNFGGLGEEMGKTTSGRITQMQNALGDLRETIGETLATALAPFIKKITEWAQRPETVEMFKKLAGAAVEFGRAIAAFVMPIVTKVINKFEEWASKHPELVKVVLAVIGALIGFGMILTVLGTALTAISLIMAVVGKVFVAVGVVIGALSSPILIVIGLLAIIGAAIYVVARNWRGAMSTISNLWHAYVVIPLHTAWIEIQAKLKTIYDFFEYIWFRISAVTHKVWSGIVNGIKGFINSIIRAINGMISGLNKIHISIPSWVPSLGGKSLGFNIGYIPYLAEGGLITQPTLAMVGEAGPEAVVPLNKSGIGNITVIVKDNTFVNLDEVVDRVDRVLAERLRNRIKLAY